MILAYHTPFCRIAIASAALLAGMLGASAALASGDGLAERMAHLQRHTHKLQLSVEARNGALVGFYVHEIEEIAEGIRDEIPSYDDHPVGKLVGEILLPAVESMEETAESGDWAAADAAFDRLLGACNACHASTAHGYVRIVRGTGNPYNQDFSPAD